MSTLVSMRNSLRSVRSHPLTRENNLTAFMRLFYEKFASRLLAHLMFIPCVDSCRLVIKRGKVGATCKNSLGLHAVEYMGSLLHFLRLDELFIDTGARVGLCTVFDVDLCQKRVVAFEPISSTFLQLLENVNVNLLRHRVRVFGVGLFPREGRLLFSDQMVAENHASLAEHGQSVQTFQCK
jgi:hypothetical protein